MSEEKRINVTKDGPYMVYGEIPLDNEEIEKDAMGRSVKWKETKKLYPDEPYALCRCGRSTDKPYCTGDHVSAHFNGSETAPRDTYDDRARAYSGADGAVLLQDPGLCVSAGFCHGRYNVGETVRNKKTMDIALQQTHDCPGGSLVIEIDGKKQEKKFDKSISATTTPSRMGPLWVKGEIPVISSDGYEYEVRNRMALCRCGKSMNKPFCDGMHMR